jgi:hypothetical protein
MAAMAAPVPAPSAPVLTARHPGDTPQPASASDAAARNIEAPYLITDPLRRSCLTKTKTYRA